jgi:hypothetical protein
MKLKLDPAFKYWNGNMLPVFGSNTEMQTVPDAIKYVVALNSLRLKIT